MIKSSIAAWFGVLPALVAVELFLFAQAAAPESLPALAANFGGYGLLGWYLYYTTRFLVPRLNDKHAIEMEKRDQVIERVVADFRAEMKDNRIDNAANRQAFRSGLQCNLSLAHENELLKKRTQGS